MVGTYTLTYTQILRAMETDADELHRQAVEAEIKALPHHVYSILRLHEDLSAVSAELDSGGYHSPKFKSADESFYRQSDGPAASPENRILDLMEQEDKILAELRPHEEAYYSLAKRLGRLTPEEVDLLSMVYERRLSFRTIADLKFCSKDSARRMRDRILDKL